MDSARYTRAIPLAEAWSKLKLNNKNTAMINSDKYCVKSYFTIRFNIFFLFYWNSAAYFPFVFRWCKTFSASYSYLKLEREKKIKLNLRNTKKLSIILTEFRFSCVQLAVHCYASKRNSMQIFNVRIIAAGRFFISFLIRRTTRTRDPTRLTYSFRAVLNIKAVCCIEAEFIDG